MNKYAEVYKHDSERERERKKGTKYKTHLRMMDYLYK